MIKICITPSVENILFNLNRNYFESVIDCGCLPIIPGYKDISMIDEYINMCDGLMLTGGWDIDPALYNEEKHETVEGIQDIRDEFEIEIFKRALKSGKPILGICRGMQVMNVAMGGRLIQHMEGHRQEEERHISTHKVVVEQGSILNVITGKNSIGVNSLHHQALPEDGLGKGVKVCGKAEDGTVEAITVDAEQFVLGVQWHPESMYKTCEDNFNIIKYFVKKVEENKNK